MVAGPFDALADDGGFAHALTIHLVERRRKREIGVFT